jgi:hypothetical protein
VGGRDNMDFLLSLLISGIISTAFLIAGVIIFFGRLKEISNQLTMATKKSLQSFGIAGLFLSALPSMGLVESTFVPILIAGLFLCMLISQLYLSVTEEKKIRSISIILSLLMAILTIEGITRFLLVPYPLPPGALILILPAFLITAVGGALYVLRESPSPFTGSMLIIIIFTIIAAINTLFGDLTATPQYFMIQIIPVIVTAGVLSSMLRPWRNIVSLSMLFLVLSIGPALFIPGYLAGNMTIFLFTTAVTFALVCLTIPLSFFLKQAVETSARTALYIASSLVAIGLLALTHANNFSIANSAPGNVWDEYILFIDWVLGLMAVSTFTMASIAASFSSTIRQASQQVIVGFSSALLVLGHPIVRWVEFGGESIQRWELDPLYLGVFAMLIVSFAVFFRVSYQLWKAGSGRAAIRFILFMFAALYFGIVAMFADNIPLDFLVPLLLLAGAFMILSSPQRNPFAKAS